MPNGARQILKTKIATGEVMEYPSTLAVHVHIFESEKTGELPDMVTFHVILILIFYTYLTCDLFCL